MHGGVVDGAGDHRIVMAAAIAATRTSGEVMIKGAEAAEKSYPDFFKDYSKLGGSINVIHLE
jgi:3-phosphoshikimate 1-carboxyvinyltransferase